MGHRANYVLVEEAKWSLFYSHWSASAVDRDFLWGPDHALEFVRKQEPTEGWLDDVWCEGGALINLPKKLLLWFGGEAEGDLLRLRLLMGLMQRLWSGWSVRFAFGGLDDFVDHLGLSRELVRSDHDYKQGLERMILGGDHTWTVVSVAHADGTIGLCRAPYHSHQLFDFPVAVVDRLAAFAKQKSLRIRLDGDQAILGGYHIDLAARRVDLWGTDSHPPLDPWDGWSLVHHGDAIEEQIARTGGAIEVEAPSQEEVLERMSLYLLSTQKFSPHALIEKLREREEEMQVNAHFLEYNPHEIVAEKRAKILSWAMAGLPRLWDFR